MYTYIIEVILFQLGFLLVFEVFLKKETFFNYNRLYLLATPILAFLIPFLKLEFLVEAVPQNTGILLPEVFIGNKPVAQIGNQTASQANPGLEINWWYLTYLAGFAVSFFLFLKKYHSLNRLFRFRKITEEKDFKIIEIPNSNIACTFLNTIFLGDQLSENEKNQILSHELVHVKHKHSLDLIFFEIMKIIFWFNPLIYIYQSRIAGLHEFIADDEVVKTTDKQSYYQQLLNTVFSTQNISFINQFFNHSLIKKRIFMLQKNKSSKLSKFKFLLIVPLLLSMLTYVACSEDNLDPNNNQVTDVDQQMELLLEALKDKENLSETEKEIYVKLLKRREEGNLNSIQKKTNAQKGTEKYLTKVPYAVTEIVPAFPGCEQYLDDVRKNCTSSEISNFVNKNFNTDLGKQLGLTGINRVIVQFRIDETGKVVDVRARAPHAELEAEAKRVISSLPQMEPGIHDGRKVSVMYSLPIAFKIVDQS